MINYFYGYMKFHFLLERKYCALVGEQIMDRNRSKGVFEVSILVKLFNKQISIQNHRIRKVRKSPFTERDLQCKGKITLPS